MSLAATTVRAAAVTASSTDRTRSRPEARPRGGSPPSDPPLRARRNRPEAGVLCGHATAAAAQRSRVLRQVLRRLGGERADREARATPPAQWGAGQRRDDASPLRGTP